VIDSAQQGGKELGEEDRGEARSKGESCGGIAEVTGQKNGHHQVRGNTQWQSNGQGGARLRQGGKSSRTAGGPATLQ
jgi:hypothetical protein